MTLDAQRELTVLEAIERDQQVTQRRLAATLGIALGLANVYLRRLATKGYLHCVSAGGHRVMYVITAEGLKEKRRLTHEFVAHSLGAYRQVRGYVSQVVQACHAEGHNTIAVFGTGEVAELVYLALKEKGLEPAAVFGPRSGEMFLGAPVRGLDECADVAFDRLVVAMLDTPVEVMQQLAAARIAPEKLLTFTPAQEARPS